MATRPDLINSTSARQCPFGYRRDPRSGDCVKVISSVDRLTASVNEGAMQQSASMPPTPTRLQDGLLPIYGTVGTIINTVLSAAVVVGAVGGIVYMIKAKPFSRRKG